MAVWQAKAPVAQVFLADVIATGASISMNQCIKDYNKLVPAVGNFTKLKCDQNVLIQP